MSDRHHSTIQSFEDIERYLLEFDVCDDTTISDNTTVETHSCASLQSKQTQQTDQSGEYSIDDHEPLELRESDKYQNRYRVKSARAQWWDYSNDGFYFITICTHKHTILFGDVINGEMRLSEMGQLVHRELMKSFEIRPTLIHHQSVIMPNHIHLIVEINNHENCISNGGDNTTGHDIVNVETHSCASLQSNKTTQSERSGVAYRSKKSISSFVAQFKSTVSRQINRSNSIWQTRFHDHIIHNQNEYNLIYDYIQNNPRVWDKDRFNTGKNK